MKTVFIPYKKENSFEVEENYIIDNFIGKNLNLGYSVVRTHLDGKHPLMKNTLFNRTYYIIDGFAKFEVEGEVFKLNAGDTLTIKKDTKYKFEGKFDSILISCPAFDEKYDIIYRD